MPLHPLAVPSSSPCIRDAALYALQIMGGMRPLLVALATTTASVCGIAGAALEGNKGQVCSASESALQGITSRKMASRHAWPKGVVTKPCMAPCMHACERQDTGCLEPHMPVACRSVTWAARGEKPPYILKCRPPAKNAKPIPRVPAGGGGQVLTEKFSVKGQLLHTVPEQMRIPDRTLRVTEPGNATVDSQHHKDFHYGVLNGFLPHWQASTEELLLRQHKKQTSGGQQETS